MAMQIYSLFLCGCYGQNPAVKKMKVIRVFGMGDYKTRELLKNLYSALDGDTRLVRVEEIDDIDLIMQRGVRSTPALEIDGVLIREGAVPASEEIAHLIDTIFRGDALLETDETPDDPSADFPPSESDLV